MQKLDVELKKMSVATPAETRGEFFLMLILGGEKILKFVEEKCR